MRQRVRRCILMKKTCGGEHKVALSIPARESLLPLEMASVDGHDAGVGFGGIRDVLGIPKRRVWIQEMVTARGERDPFVVWCEGGKVRGKPPEGLLDGQGCTGLPFFKCLPGGLERTHDAFLKVGRVLLHDNDRFLEEVFLVDLFLELAGDGLVGNVTGGR